MTLVDRLTRLDNYRFGLLFIAGHPGQWSARAYPGFFLAYRIFCQLQTHVLPDVTGYRHHDNLIALAVTDSEGAALCDRGGKLPGLPAGYAQAAAGRS